MTMPLEIRLKESSLARGDTGNVSGALLALTNWFNEYFAGDKQAQLTFCFCFTEF